MKAFPFNYLYYFNPHPEVSNGIGVGGLGDVTWPCLDPYKDEARGHSLRLTYTAEGYVPTGVTAEGALDGDGVMLIS